MVSDDGSEGKAFRAVCVSWIQQAQRRRNNDRVVTCRRTLASVAERGFAPRHPARNDGYPSKLALECTNVLAGVNTKSKKAGGAASKKLAAPWCLGAELVLGISENLTIPTS
jgi:hypothetical protein